MMMGGDGAAENALKVAGDMNQQWDNVFKGNGNTSNALVPNKSGGSRRRRRGGNAVASMGIPTSQASTPKSTGGSRRRRRGGFWGSIINKAIVPFSILGLQQTYGRRRRSNGGTRRRRRH
jgi:hypothetical protein